MFLSTFLLYLTLGACAALVAVVAIRYDLYEREPWPLLALATALGALLMWAVGQGQIFIVRRFGVSDATLAVMAGVSEETAKLAVVLLIAATARRHFNDPIDGLIYGSFAGLGAALEESVWVLRQMYEPRFLPPQEPVRLAGHLVMGGIAGFGAGLLVMRPRRAALGIALSLAAAAALHTLWDIVAFAAADYYRLAQRLRPWHTATPMAIMLVGMLAYRRLVSEGARLARRHLQLCDARSRKGPGE